MKLIINCSLLVYLLLSCNFKHGSAIRESDFKFGIDSLVIYKPIYDYIEYISYEPQDEKYWIFIKDTSAYFNSFTKELIDFLSTKKSTFFSTNQYLSELQLDSCFALLNRNSKDSFNLFYNSAFKTSKVDLPIGFLKVRFVMNKETGTSGLGPIGTFTPLGNYYISFFVVRNNKLVLYEATRRPAIVNGMYTNKRSRSAIKSFFRRL
jgi:hypothetical protein